MRKKGTEGSCEEVKVANEAGSVTSGEQTKESAQQKRVKSKKDKYRKGGTLIHSTSDRADPPIPNQRGLSIIITNNIPSSTASVPGKKDRKGRSVTLESNNIPSPKAQLRQQELIKTDRAGKEDGDPVVTVDTQGTNNSGSPIVASVHRQKKKDDQGKDKKGSNKSRSYRLETITPDLNIPSASILTQLILVSRIPAYLTTQDVVDSISTIAKLLGKEVDWGDFQEHYQDPAGPFLSVDNRSMLLVKLTSPALFSTLGNFGGPSLPLLFFTQKRYELKSAKLTKCRLAVQAMPMDTPLHATGLVEVATIRGFPECCHAMSTLLPIILQHLQTSLSSDVIPVITTSRLFRHKGEGREKATKVEEMYLRVYTKPGNLVSQFRESLGSISTSEPTTLDLGCWMGQIASSHTQYEFSPTNLPALIHQSYVLFIEGVRGTLVEDLYSLQPYFSHSTEFSSVGYIRGSIDSPTHPFPKDVLLLLPTMVGGGTIDFNYDKWTTDNPVYSGYHINLPGSTALSNCYITNPPPRTHVTPSVALTVITNSLRSCPFPGPSS